jgi:UDP-N-acetylmuramyl pentapeptide phosphotransferase/UDP-N-acetylglucosamine-1-phosphate transferase
VECDPRARVFLGDVGSYRRGAALAVLAACAVLDGIPVEAALAPLALYLTDTAWTLQRRIRAGERWFEAHRSHTYQQLCDLGWSHQRVAAVTAGTTLLLCLRNNSAEAQREVHEAGRAAHRGWFR